jgi:hypothetical protein
VLGIEKSTEGDMDSDVEFVMEDGDEIVTISYVEPDTPPIA